MEISTNTLLNLLDAAEAKNVKDAIKNMPIKGVENTKPPTETSIKAETIKGLVEALFKDLATNTKSKEGVANILKESNIEKSMQTASSDLKALVDLVKSNKSLVKFAPALEKLLLHVKDLDVSTLKAQISKSGVFLESKIDGKTTQNMPLPLKEVLISLKQFIVQSFPKTDFLVDQIDKLLNAPKADKAFVEDLKGLIKGLKSNTNLTNNIKSIIQKIENILTQKLPTTKTNVKKILIDLKQIMIQALHSKTDLHVAQINNLLNAPKADKVFVEDLKGLIKDLNSNTNLTNDVKRITQKLESIINQKSSIANTNIKEILLALKQNISQNSNNSNLHVKNIDKLLNTPKADKGFIEDIKNLISDLKVSKSVNKPIVELTAKLETLMKQSQLIESKIQNSVSLIPKEVMKVANEIKVTLHDLKQLAQTSSTSKTPAILEKAEVIIKMVDQNLSIQNFFPKDLPKATISEKIQQVVNLLKIELSKTEAKSSLHVEVSKLANKLEGTIKTAIADKTIMPNQKLHVETTLKSEIANDIKATLLNMKKELSVSVLPSAKEALMQVDKLLTQVDFYQLNSFATNSNSLYLPFLWEGLDGGQISIKRLKENKFFCEINLTLKEYGKIDLMIMLFDDININMSVFAEKKEFLELVEENLSALKQGINKLGLIPSNIHLYDAKQGEKLKEDTRVFVNSSQLGLGINLHV